MTIIQEKIPVCELLAGLAEEATELAQAALKLRRCYDGTNPTSADADQAYANLLEEIGDVELYEEQLSINRNVIQDYKRVKLSRWVSRIIAAGRRVTT